MVPAPVRRRRRSGLLLRRRPRGRHRSKPKHFGCLEQCCKLSRRCSAPRATCRQPAPELFEFSVSDAGHTTHHRPAPHRIYCDCGRLCRVSGTRGLHLLCVVSPAAASGRRAHAALRPSICCAREQRAAQRTRFVVWRRPRRHRYRHSRATHTTRRCRRYARVAAPTHRSGAAHSTADAARFERGHFQLTARLTAAAVTARFAAGVLSQPASDDPCRHVLCPELCVVLRHASDAHAFT